MLTTKNVNFSLIVSQRFTVCELTISIYETNINRNKGKV